MRPYQRAPAGTIRRENDQFLNKVIYRIFTSCSDCRVFVACLLLVCCLFAACLLLVCCLFGIHVIKLAPLSSIVAAGCAPLRAPVGVNERRSEHLLRKVAARRCYH